MPNIKSLPKHERPREKMIELGPANLKDRDLLAIIFRTGREGKDVLEISDEILRKHPMKSLINLCYGDLVKIKGIDAGKACSILAAFELTKRALEHEDDSLPIVNTAKDALAHLGDIRIAKKEHFAVLYLNARNQLIHKEVISVGTLNANLVHPREVFKPAIDFLAARIVIAHNHPSGGAEPSEADLELTRRLREAGKLIGVEVLDHLILTKKEHCVV